MERLVNHEDGGQANDTDITRSIGEKALLPFGASEAEEVERQQEKLKKGIKVVIGGPPHSGKSVFFHSLLRNLPSAYPLVASPDGEGFWTHDLYRQGHGSIAEEYRSKIKGGYTTEFRDYCKKIIDDWRGPLMLIDMGGRINEKDSSMIGGATHAIILASDLSEVKPWREFFKENNIEVMATLHSNYDGSCDLELPQDLERTDMVGSVHHLEKGEIVAERQTLKKVASQIQDLVDNNHFYLEAEKHSPLNEKILHIPEDFTTLPKDENGFTLPSAVPVIYENISKINKNLSWVDGVRCSWETMAFVLALEESGASDIRVRAYDSFVQMKSLPESEEINKSLWDNPRRIGEMDGSPVYVIHSTTSQGKNLVGPMVLDTLSIPSVPQEAIVIISGAGPNWLKASIALGYKDKVAGIAGFQPGVGSTIVWAKNKDYLGKVLPGNV